ncbi:MAG: hypothetical protein ACXVUL_10860 [Solirubrobacteraceae bacterium]
MVALVSVETVLLVLLVVLVAGLLRSHAEIMRRLGPAEDASGVPDGPAIPAARNREAVSAPEVAGVTPDGDAVKLAFGGAGTAPTLLAFLTSGCGTCASFWEALGERRLPAGVRTVIVTHGPGRERSVKLRSLGPAGIPVVMSSQAWADYEIPGAPYFVMVDQAIRGEGVATTWPALASLVSDAIEEQRDAGRAGGGAGAVTGERRAERIDETFAAAGIDPGHPSLYPDRRT